MGAGFGLCLLGRAVLLLQLFTVSLAWGKEGHYAICKIAQGLLTEDAASAVRLLLPDYADGDLAAVCSWADEIRHHYRWRWTSPLHYVDTPDFRCNYEYCRDCHDSAGNKDRCVSGAIYNYSMQLTTYLDSTYDWQYNLTEALMFLSHFIGDIHQPLHVGFVGDEGGNTIIVRWYRRKTNLHHVWDNMIIESAMKEFYHASIDEMIQAIKRNMLDWSADISSWENCASNHTACPDPYASESVKLACNFAYRNATPGSTLTGDMVKPWGQSVTSVYALQMSDVWAFITDQIPLEAIGACGKAVTANCVELDAFSICGGHGTCNHGKVWFGPILELADDYFLSRLPVVEKRLAQSGVRLAATLNRIFSSPPSRSQQ